VSIKRFIVLYADRPEVGWEAEDATFCTRSAAERYISEQNEKEGDLSDYSDGASWTYAIAEIVARWESRVTVKRDLKIKEAK
jgi:hypothetical protein